MALGVAGDVAWRVEVAVSWPALGLSACVLGLVLCPFAYIPIGALSGFAPAFALIALPPLLVGVGYLLYRYLRTPAQGAASAWQLLAEGLGMDQGVAGAVGVVCGDAGCADGGIH